MKKKNVGGNKDRKEKPMLGQKKRESRKKNVCRKETEVTNIKK